jgi:hypothetical protein
MQSFQIALDLLYINNKINMKIPTTLDSNTHFLGENAIRKGFFHTSYGKILCTQFDAIVVGFC